MTNNRRQDRKPRPQSDWAVKHEAFLKTKSLRPKIKKAAVGPKSHVPAHAEYRPEHNAEQIQPMHEKSAEGMKLQQYIAHAGVSSRRKAEDYIREGRVTVNGTKITDVTARVDEKKDHVKVDGHLIRKEQLVYIVMNKPEGCITAVSDDQDRTTVVDLLKDKISQRIYPVGRLDFNTTGALILTNDGGFANSIMHPKFEIPKRYVAKVKGRIAPFALNRLKKGLKLINEDGTEGRFVRAAEAGIYKRNDANDLVYITITEGINHQVKRMLEAVGASVIRLKRENVGPVTASRLEPGQWRFLTEDEIKYFIRVKK
jgi:23S rRNA pseudouridine2605 synthase